MELILRQTREHHPELFFHFGKGRMRNVTIKWFRLGLQVVEHTDWRSRGRAEFYS